MRLATSVPKMTSPESDGEYGRKDGLIFCKAEEEIDSVLRRTLGRTLFVSDEGGFGVFASAAGSPRAVSAVIGEDCLSLFSMPDVSAVIGAGGKNVLIAARFYAELMRIPCTLIPTVATLNGTSEENGRVLVNGDTFSARLAKATVVCDMEVLRPTLARAYSRLLLGELEGFEAEALRNFGLPAFCAEPIEEGLSPEELVGKNASLTLQGEGAVLAELLERDGERNPEWRAYLQLSALYAAFFEKGKPRRYFIPDYQQRADAAGVSGYRIPTAEEYARRAIALERMRAVMTKKILSLTERRGEFAQALRAFSAEETEAGDLTRLKYLPEIREGGLSSLIRDFGLMEW